MNDRPELLSDEVPPAARMIGRRLLSYDPESGQASLSFLAKPEFSNRHGGVQGGILAAMLDSAAGATLHAGLGPGLTAVTLQLNTTFLKPAPIGPLSGTARLISKDERDAHVEAEILSPEGVVVARATAHLRILKRRQDR